MTVPLDDPVGGYDEFATFSGEIGYLAVAGDTLFVAGMDGTVWSLPVSGGSDDLVEVVTGLSGVRGIAAHDGVLYIGEAGVRDADDRIVAVPFGGGEVTLVADVVGINDLALSVDPCSGSSCLPVVGSLFGSLG